MPPSIAGLGKAMEQNDRRPFPCLHIVLPDIVGADRVMLDLSHDDVLSRATATAGQSIAVKTRDGCYIDKLIRHARRDGAAASWRVCLETARHGHRGTRWTGRALADCQRHAYRPGRAVGVRAGGAARGPLVAQAMKGALQ